MTLPELAIKRHVTTLMMLVSFAVLGTVATVRIPLAFLPDMERPVIYVNVPYPNASPEQVEHMIVQPVEEALASVGGMTSMWSWCNSEGGMVRLEFDWSVDLHLARVEVWEKLDRIRSELPEDIEDITVGDHHYGKETDDPILEGRLSSNLDLSENYDLLERRIVRPLQRVPGVAQVQLDGVNPREVHVNLRLADMELHKIDVREVSRILRASNFDESLGKVTEGETRYTLRTLGSFRDVEEIRDLVLRSDGLRVRNVADVTYEEPELEYGRHLDGNFAVGITVSAEASANSVAVCEALEERIARMDRDPELQGMEFLVWMNQGREIKKTLTELFITGILGAILAAIVRFIFLRRWSSTFVSVICIPQSLVVSCGIIWLKGSTMNTLTLLGLIVGIGMLVDNAVVVIENIFRHQEMGHDRNTASALGAKEVSTAVIAATLTSVIVFLPVVFNRPSEMNIQLKEIGVTVCLTLLASLLISQTLIPLATSWVIRSQPRPRERWMVWLEDRYVQLLELNLRHRWLTPAIGVVLAVSAIYPYQRVDWNFEAEHTSRYAQIYYRFSEDKPIHVKEQVVSQIEAIIEPHREEMMVQSIYSWWSEGGSMTRVYLKEGLANEENLAKVRARLREILPEIAGLKLDVSKPHYSWRHDRGKKVSLRIVGDDPEVLAELAHEARRRLQQIDGLSESYASDRKGQQELYVALNRDLVARYDLSAMQLADAVGLTFRGRRLPRFRTPDGEREMRLTLEEQETESMAQLHNLPMWTREGDKVRLAAVAEFNQIRGAERIERNDRMNGMWVTAQYQTGTREQYVPLVEQTMNNMDFPFGYSWNFGSWRQRRAAQTRELAINLSLALLLVFAVMSGLFESVQRAIALMIALPFALTGAIWTLYLADADFDQPAAVGVLLLIGIVVNNGIVMIAHINSYQRQGIPRHEAMLRGCRERLRPILMTAVTTLLGLVPLVVQNPRFGGMHYSTMALVIMGGLTLSTFLTSVLLPTTVTLVEDAVALGGRWRKRLRPRSGLR